MYKVIQNNQVVDVIQDPHFITFLPTGHVTITNKEYAKGIIGSDGCTLYSFTPNKRSDIQLASNKEITSEEFNRLQSLLNSNKEPYIESSALEEAKQVVIKRLSNICKNKITAGFTISLSDGERYNFRLTAEDQLNLIMIEHQISSGVESFVYHATNQPCKVFSKDDMIKVIEAFKHHTLYHTTYFNAAKQYIKTLTDIEKINVFTYGTNIADTIQDFTIKQILKNGDVR